MYVHKYNALYEMICICNYLYTNLFHYIIIIIIQIMIVSSIIIHIAESIIGDQIHLNIYDNLIAL